ncbi:hypothetical protein ACFPFP_20540 [Bradyrhizobium sp. GCM10023182]|uniref:Uncharacterized protein n=1 Tax=Bradyrhizobium zhengyangense TaxID=2911009 RepID=A0ABS9LQQ5_9BRAD|nr:hypothetical protein [Bradyrhizobium zhengyangense]MCG2669343.1 hypothetical protein [Bradyrhizobium zhengyangense]
MAERYYLGQMILGTGEPLEITKEEYEGALKAVQTLLHALDAEEKYDGVIENYRELEEFMLGQAFQSLLSIRTGDDVQFQVPRNTTARKLSNFLSSVRLYLDSAERHATAITGDAETGPQLHREKSRQFDTFASYRALEAIRNHAQHFALPVHGFTVGLRRSPDFKHSEHSFNPSISVSELAQNPRFHPPKTLQELQQGPDTLELKPMVREYVESLSTIHRCFRELTQETVDKQLEFFRELKSRLFFRDPDIDDIAIAVFPSDDEGIAVAPQTNLSSTLHNYLDYLRAKNPYLVTFAARRVTY